MIYAAGLLAMFCIVNALCYGIAYLGILPLTTWHLANCLNRSATCSVSANVLSCWWLAYPVVVLAVTLLVNQIFILHQSRPHA